jgi:hypothetical protein
MKKKQSGSQGPKNYKNRPLDIDFLTLYQRSRRDPHADSISHWIEAVVSKELEDLSEDQLTDLHISVLQKLEAAIAKKLAAGGGKVAPNSALTRLPLEDAIKGFLRSADGPRKPSQVCKGLKDADYPFVGADPQLAVRTAFLRLAATDKNFVYVGSGKWTLESNYTAAKFKNIKDKYAGRGGRSSEEHGNKTRDGMRAKGKLTGRKPKFGPEHIAEFRRLVDNKILKPVPALKKVGISYAYYHHYKKQIYAWKSGDPWPPTRYDKTALSGVSGDQLRAMGVIPLHSKLVGEK